MITGATAQSLKFEYDHKGIRTKKVSGGTVTNYFTDQSDRVIVESDANGNVAAQVINGHRPLSRIVDGKWYYYVYNGHGDVVKVVDENGSIVNRYEYDEWGNLLSSSESVDNPIRYTGQYYDKELDLYYLRARYYDPKVGRFLSEDSYEGEIGNPLSLNYYVYCYGNPVGFKDFTGHSPLPTIMSDGGQVYSDGSPIIDNVVSGVHRLTDYTQGFTAGFRDTYSLGVTAWIRGDSEREYIHNLRDYSNAYKTGQGVIVIASVTQLAKGVYAASKDMVKNGWGATVGFVDDAFRAGNSSVKTSIKSLISRDPSLVRHAEKMGRNRSVQAEANHLINEFVRGNLNPGIGSKSLFKDVSYLRGRHGARVFFRMVDDTMEILGKASKANEQKVIEIITKLYK